MKYIREDKENTENPLLQWLGAFFSGNTRSADNMLAASDPSLDMKIAVAMDFFWKHGPYVSDDSDLLFNEVKSELKSEKHTCQPHPCIVCCNHAYLLASVGMFVGAYPQAIQETDRLLALNEDDITALLIRGRVKFFSALGIENEPEAVLTDALEDFEAAGRFVAELPDDTIYNTRYLRDGNIDVRELDKIDATTLVLNVSSFATGQDASAIQFTARSIPRYVVEGMMMAIRGQILIRLNRYNEALPLLNRSLEIARKMGDQPNTAGMLYVIGQTLIATEKSVEAVPFLVESLSLAGTDEELRSNILEVLTSCLPTIPNIDERMRINAIILNNINTPYKPPSLKF